MKKKDTDHSGEVYNGWTLMRRVCTSEKRHAFYEAQCGICGRSFVARYADIKGRKPCMCYTGKVSVRKNPERYLYMAVTSDALELPVAVTDTIEELSKITGSSVDRIRFAVTPSGAKRYSRNKATRSGFRFYLVLADEKEA